MRPVSRIRPELNERARRAALPVAVAGSIALSLSTVPAYADVQEAETLRPHGSGLGLAPAPGGAALGPNGAVFAAPAPKGASFVSTAASARIAPKPVPAAAASSTYVVKPGDTVSAIASRFGMRAADVLALNGLGWKSVIYPGQTLTLSNGVPASAPAAPAPVPASSYTVQPGDTVSAIAKRHGTTVSAVFAANGLDWASVIYPGQPLSIPGAGASSPATPAPAPAPAPAPSAAYTIAAGDTMSGIAQRHGVTTHALLAANGLDASSIIYPGQTIAIPLAAVPASAPTVPGLDAEQVANAQLIIRVGRELGVPDRGIAIALGTAMQESWIRNLDWGDRDSLGLFQQRPSAGWGTPDEVRDPVRSIKAFFGGSADPNGARTRGLLDIPGWQDLSFADAAQAVQLSAYPERYAGWEASAYAWLAALG